MITLALIVFASVIALIPWNDESSGTQSPIRPAEARKWPSVFNATDPAYLSEPEPPALNEELLGDIATAFGFRYGQNHSLNQIQREYSGTRIAAKARVSQLRFRSSFGDTYDFIDSLMTQKSGDEWSRAIRSVMEKNESVLEGNVIRRSEAEAFIETVNERIQGDLPSPTLETLLMFNPEYIERPEKIFDDGFTKQYRTGGHPKSNGVDLGILYPASWKAKEGRRPNMVQTFRSDNGRGTIMASILVREFPEELSRRSTESSLEKALLDLDKDVVFGSILPDAEVIETGTVRLAGELAIWGQYEVVMNRAGIEISLHGLHFVLARQGKMVQVMYAAGSELSDESTSAQASFEHHGALFQRMTNTIDFFGRYE
jgi:hypothetical protein